MNTARTAPPPAREPAPPGAARAGTRPDPHRRTGVAPPDDPVDFAARLGEALTASCDQARTATAEGQDQVAPRTATAEGITEPDQGAPEGSPSVPQNSAAPLQQAPAAAGNLPVPGAAAAPHRSGGDHPADAGQASGSERPVGGEAAAVTAPAEAGRAGSGLPAGGPSGNGLPTGGAPGAPAAASTAASASTVPAAARDKDGSGVSSSPAAPNDGVTVAAPAAPNDGVTVAAAAAAADPVPGGDATAAATAAAAQPVSSDARSDRPRGGSAGTEAAPGPIDLSQLAGLPVVPAAVAATATAADSAAAVTDAGAAPTAAAAGTATAAVPVAAAAGAAPAVSAPAPVAAAAAPTTAETTAAPLPAQLAQHVERVADIVRMSAAHGVARARLALHPDDLGSVDVRLRATSQGLVAAISVDRPETLLAVTRAGAELQQQLADRGLTVLRLDITLSADGHAAAARDFAGQAGPREDRRAPSRAGTAAPSDGVVAVDEAVELDPSTRAQTVRPGAGTVDVRA